MHEKNNAVCSICGKEYHICLSCSDAMKLHPWKIYTDTQECFKVFQVVRGFSTGVYTKDEAREKLQNIDLKDINSFRPHIKKIVKDILREENRVAKTIEKMEGAVAEDIIKPTVLRKRNNKMETE